MSTDYCSSDYCSRDYIFIDKEPMSWSEARSCCTERHTDLAVIGSPQDVNRVVDEMNENNVFSFWVGLHEDVFTWRWSQSDPVHLEAGFRNWAAGEPNEQTGAPLCVGMQDTGGWQDLDCGGLHYFLCFGGNILANILYFQDS